MLIGKVRETVVTRDGYCRIGKITGDPFGPCAGPSEWAHFGDYKRFKTRGKPPEERHTTEGSLMLCTKHHTDYDHGRLLLEPRTPLGADGNLTAYTPSAYAGALVTAGFAFAYETQQVHVV